MLNRSGSKFYIIFFVWLFYAIFWAAKFKWRHKLVRMIAFQIVCMVYSDFFQ
jgi:hypothetical protein